MIPIAKPYIGKEEKEAIMKVLDSGMLARGKVAEEFEERFSKFCNVKHAIMTSSGTTALQTCVKVTGIKQGDEIITTPFTFIATANCILSEKAKPVFVDIKEDTFNIDPEKVEEKIGDKTKAIIPVDLYGQCYDYDKIKNIADKNNLAIIEDACQAVGAELDGKKAGSLGNISSFSLYATKNIVSGEGGVITTDDDDLAEKARIFINQGQKEKYDYFDVGFNYRINDIQAAIALEQLKKIVFITNKRIENAKLLSEGLKDVEGISVPFVKENCKHVFHQYTLKVDGYKLTRDELLQKLKKNGIGANIYYPKPLHLTAVYSKFGYKKGDLPIAEEMAEKVLSLPIHPWLTKQEIDKIIETIKC